MATQPASPGVSAKAMYMLRFDHRESLEHGLFGWTGALSREQAAQVAAAKRVVYAAWLKAIDDGVSRDCAALLIDEQFGRDILGDARARGLVTTPAHGSHPSSMYSTTSGFAASNLARLKTAVAAQEGAHR